MFNNRRIVPIAIVFCLGMNPLYSDGSDYPLSSKQPLDSFSTSDQSQPNRIKPLVNPEARDQRGGRGDCTWLGC
ncbi:MAG: hypothetical protein J7545_23450 [Roseofilum sp. SBFL]|uniref:hypothetical protein n=1 Tax=unclassified Roseofilum TaxID=2620099 RepID=UPI001B00A492|nr:MULTISPECIES: hypothetical protein [unclassified Roseofilum]MBP0014750.1 hypothetical protein [Roseofilum sp. SID3]MBP0026506.1 hypothetical protein [Roseofilum sp. SID2]MBP0036312.1 hypothetical protein [Roseofilum sp. SID1]MBP0044893.1 hypothetical protein [Roseofilum sp. SBFL]